MTISLKKLFAGLLCFQIVLISSSRTLLPDSRISFPSTACISKEIFSSQTLVAYGISSRLGTLRIGLGAIIQKWRTPKEENDIKIRRVIIYTFGVIVGLVFVHAAISQLTGISLLHLYAETQKGILSTTGRALNIGISVVTGVLAQWIGIYLGNIVVRKTRVNIGFTLISETLFRVLFALITNELYGYLDHAGLTKTLSAFAASFITGTAYGSAKDILANYLLVQFELFQLKRNGKSNEVSALREKMTMDRLIYRGYDSLFGRLGFIVLQHAMVTYYVEGVYRILFLFASGYGLNVYRTMQMYFSNLSLNSKSRVLQSIGWACVLAFFVPQLAWLGFLASLCVWLWCRLKPDEQTLAGGDLIGSTYLILSVLSFNLGVFHIEWLENPFPLLHGHNLATVWHRNMTVFSLIFLGFAVAWLYGRSRKNQEASTDWKALLRRPIAIETKWKTFHPSLLGFIALWGSIYTGISTGLGFWAFAYFERSMSTVIVSASTLMSFFATRLIFPEGSAARPIMSMFRWISIGFSFVAILGAALMGNAGLWSGIGFGLSLGALTGWMSTNVLPFFLPKEGFAPFNRLHLSLGGLLLGMPAISLVRYWAVPSDIPWTLFSTIGVYHTAGISMFLLGGITLLTAGLARVRDPILAIIIGSFAPLVLSGPLWLMGMERFSWSKLSVAGASIIAAFFWVLPNHALKTTALLPRQA